MYDAFRNIRAVGFDLDGTLYAETPAMNARFEELIAEKILAKHPELATLERAKEFSAEKFKELLSRKKTLESVGYENAGEIMEKIFQEADSAQFLNRDEALIKLLSDIRAAKEYVYLVTTAPEDEMQRKLGRLGIKTDIFDLIISGNHKVIAQKPKDADAFRYAIAQSGIAPEMHVYIGDKEKPDVLAPKSLGMMTIAVKDIPSADAQIGTIYDLRQILL